MDNDPKLLDLKMRIEHPMKTKSDPIQQLPPPLKLNRAAKVRIQSSDDHDFETLVASNDGIKELLAKIERKLPNVAAASDDLQALRGLSNLQLAEARALLSKYPLTYLNNAISSNPEV
jgi:hypothetical protein